MTRLISSGRTFARGAGRQARLRNCLFLLTSLAVLALTSPLAAQVQLRQTPLDSVAPFRRVLWVTRWDYQTPEDIAKICYNASSARFTDILFQVRGEGTAYFRSPHEPWAWQLSGLGIQKGLGVDPGWDPLATAIAEGRRRGLRVHAYLNVLPVWAQKENPPQGRGQIFADHRDWLMVDKRGRTIEVAGFYAFADPGLPEVRDHLARLYGQVAADYPVDGIHLDYIRYPFEHGDFSYHPRVVAAFEEHYGAHPDERPEEWVRFKQAQITATVGAISEVVREARPGIEITASVIADPVSGPERGAQDVPTWIRAGYVDAVAPMIYVEDLEKFGRLLDRFRQPGILARTWPGIRAIEKNDKLIEEIQMSIAEGVPAVAIFSYDYLFDAHQPLPRALRVYRTFAVNPLRQPDAPALVGTGGGGGTPIKRAVPRLKTTP